MHGTAGIHQEGTPVRIRAFISIRITDPSCLKGPLADLKVKDNVRTSPLDQMHITLKFIGDVDDGKVPRIVKAISSAVEGVSPFTVTLKGAGCFPNPKRPSVVWGGASPQDVMSGISERIGENLKACNVQFDEKPFKTHITIGRCKGPVPIDDFLSKYSKEEFSSFQCCEILLMRSELGPSGAKHTVIAKVPLPTDAA